MRSRGGAGDDDDASFGAGGATVARVAAGRGGPARAVPALAVLALTVLAPCGAHAQSTDGLAGDLDRAARAHLANPLVPGVSVAVVRGDETLLHRGYGSVDLEWNVRTPMDAEASYEIGSITKQFTAAAVLLLAEEGRLDLDAAFTEYVDFATRGRTVPLRRLLDHTSGIKGYTEMEVFGQLTPFDLPRDSLLRLVEQEPFDFEPGTAQIYNNSAYFLLGLIVEAASGMAYEDFVEERLFEPAGMQDSYYCSESAVIERRAHGYDAAGPDSLIRARYLDHTWPYAAGSLCSTVGDLVAWNRALHGGRILSDASYEAMTTPAPLVDGTPIRYAMGLGVDDRSGQRVLAHGGGINGFVSQLTYFPEEDLSIVVLQNSAAPPGAGSLAAQLAEVVLGPVPEAAPIAYDGDPGELTGTYRGPARGRTMEVSVLVEDGALAVRTGGEDAEPVRLAYRGRTGLGRLRWDGPGGRYLFVPDAAGGRASELRVSQGGGHYVLRRVGR